MSVFTNLPKPRILVVDDEFNNRNILQLLLESKYEIICVENGRVALAYLAKHSVDLVLLDIMMPQMDGYEVLKTIRSNPEFNDLPVILISALTSSKNIIEGLELGANDYITKPMDLGIVTARVKTQLDYKQLTDERKQMIEELRKAQEMRSRLFSIASHDLKNPLSNIRMAEYLLQGYLDMKKTDVAQIMSTLTASLELMEHVIGEFLDMGAIQNGRVTVNQECVNLDHIIWEVVTQFHMNAMSKNIELEMGDTVGLALADFEKTKQIIVNLLSNAIKYTPPNSTVSIWTEQRQNRLLVFFADEGPGIPEEERHLLFEEFRRLSPRPTANESSTGLGLWIVKQLAQMQNGQVGAAFPEEGGSVFWVELPLYDATKVKSSTLEQS